MFKLLIDECLSPELAAMAVQAGHAESTCVRDRGWSGKKDWELIAIVVAQDFTLVTHNAADFRGGGPHDLGGEHARQEIHAGLICLNSERPMSLSRQRALFEIALGKLATFQDLINQALEVFEAADGRVMVELYDLPAPS